MGKRPKQKQAGGPSLASPVLVAGVALTVGLFAWFRFTPESSKATSSSKPVSPEAGDDKADIVRRALFGKDGRPNYETGATPDRKRFSDHEYWEERYATEDKDYDWYGTWNSQSAVRLKAYVEHALPRGATSVLNIGCGNSRMAEELHLEGYSDIMNVDISHAVVDKMKQKFAGRAEISFQQMDATSMSFGDARFDLALEKGTLDAMYTGNLAAVEATVAEVFRVLRPGGVFVSMTFGAPRSRQELNHTAHGGPASDGLDGDVRTPRTTGDWATFETIAARKDTGARVTLEEIEASVSRKEELEFFYIYVMVKP